MTLLKSVKVTQNRWDFTAQIRDDGGLVLKDIYHDIYSFARDVRITRVWVSRGPSAKPNSFVLGSPALPMTTWKQWNAPTVNVIAPYVPAFGLSASYETSAPVVGSGSQKLQLEQHYVFTDYGDFPAHEPSGTLGAARFYPLLSFKYIGKASDDFHPRYIRVDYRLDLSIDCSLKPTKSGHPPNQAGVFADSDITFGLLPTISSIFERAEKPVPYELVGKGLDAGGSQSDWDNIHQWGLQNPLPATPGAAHAAHTHWRWSRVFAKKSTIPPSLGSSQFKGLGKPGGPILDSRIPDQSLEFAITSDGIGQDAMPAAWAADQNPSEPIFASLFTSNRPTPAAIGKGSSLTTWFSIDVYPREDYVGGKDSVWEGTFFVHGWFFAHEQENLPFGAQSIANVKDAIEKPTAKRQWRRP